jgi:hypothetical protein
MKRTIVIMTIMALAIISLPAEAQSVKKVAACPQAKKMETPNRIAIIAQAYAVDAQLRFWKNQEKTRGKVADVARLSQLIGQNVRQLWQQKLALQESAASLNIALPVSVDTLVVKKGNKANEYDDE